jgi:hypothetical protein
MDHMSWLLTVIHKKKSLAAKPPSKPLKKSHLSQKNIIFGHIFSFHTTLNEEFGVGLSKHIQYFSGIIETVQDKRVNKNILGKIQLTSKKCVFFQPKRHKTHHSTVERQHFCFTKVPHSEPRKALFRTRETHTTFKIEVICVCTVCLCPTGCTMVNHDHF